MPYKKSTKIPSTNIKLPGFVISGAIEATRGCPYGCEFCPETIMESGLQVYTRPIKDIIKELKKIPQKTIMFYDASLTIDKEYSKKLFKAMKGLKKRFFCNGNVDVLASDIELVKLSKEAGCVSWLIGFESISQPAIDEVGKKTNKVDEYSKAVRNIHNNKMAVIGCFIFGFDSDNPSIFDETLQLIKKLHIDICDFCVLTPFPGTPIFKRFDKEKRIVTKEWKNYNLKTVVYLPKQMTSEELLNGVKKMYTDFYSLPYTIKRILRGFQLGFFSFFVIMGRNIIATMNSRRLFTKK